MAGQGRGAWLSVTVTATPDSRCSFDYNYDDRPNWTVQPARRVVRSGPGEVPAPRGAGACLVPTEFLTMAYMAGQLLFFAMVAALIAVLVMRQPRPPLEEDEDEDEDEDW